MKKNTNLDARHASEIEFHDRKAQKPLKKTVYNEGGLLPVHRKMVQMAGCLDNKLLLDLGCGTGRTTIRYVGQKVAIVGLDLSYEALKTFSRLISEDNLHCKIDLVQASGEYLPFKRAFDMVLGVGVLHHLDLSHAAESINRVMKGSAKAFFMEPLAHNALINFFRKLTPKRRTYDEQPLTVESINSLKRHFLHVTFHGYGLFSPISYVFLILGYQRAFSKINDALSRIEQKAFCFFPKLQKFCWGAIIEFGQPRSRNKA